MFKLFLGLIILFQFPTSAPTLPPETQESILVPAPVANSKPMEVTTKPVTYFSTKPEKILPPNDNGEVLVIAKEPPSDLNHGILLSVKGQPNEYIEVYNLITIDGRTFASYPPKVEAPLTIEDSTSTYLVKGDECTKVGVAIRSNQIPIWLELSIEGCDSPDPDPDPNPDPTPDPNPDLSAIITKVTQITTQSTGELQDPITQAAIASKLESVVDSSGSPAEYYSRIQQAISDGLLEAEVNPPYKDWYGKFRKPVHDVLVSANLSTSDLQKVFKAILQKLKLTRSEPSELSKIKENPNVVVLYTRQGCTSCEQWKRDVAPHLRNAGWTVKVLETSVGETPRFTIHCFSNTISFTGPMSIDVFNEIVASFSRR